MPVKQYTVTRITLFTQEEFRNLLREAHEHCKREVKPSIHEIGQKRKRKVITRRRSEYLDCIKRYINDKIKERAREVLGAA